MGLALPFIFVQLAPPGPGCDDEVNCQTSYTCALYGFLCTHGVLGFVYIYVQPTCKNNNTGYAAMRQSQQCAMRLADTGYAITLDLGDPTSPHGTIHPRRKQEVGRRLMLAANAVIYGASATQQQTYGPIIDKVTAAIPDNGALTVSYKPGSATGLHAAGCADCATVNSKVRVISSQLQQSLSRCAVSFCSPVRSHLLVLSSHRSFAARSHHSRYRLTDLSGCERRWPSMGYRSSSRHHSRCWSRARWALSAMRGSRCRSVRCTRVWVHLEPGQAERSLRACQALLAWQRRRSRSSCDCAETI